jgi:DNA-binding NarL/FixJ family response regulator
MGTRAMAAGQPKRKSNACSSLRVILADDNPAMLETLVDMLHRKYVIAGTVSCGKSAVSEVLSMNPDIVVLDISLGDMTGFDVARQLKKADCNAKVIFLSVHENHDFVRAAFDLGAAGYVFKSQISPDLLKALDAVSHGERFAPEGSRF